MVNDKAYGHAVEAALVDEYANVPQQLRSFADFLRATMPAEKRLRVGAKLREGLLQPKVDLDLVWPKFAAWMLREETYGMVRYLPVNKQLRDIALELANLLGQRGQGAPVHEYKLLELAEAATQFMEKLQENKALASASACQVIFYTAMSEVGMAIRYAVAANQMGQPGPMQKTIVDTVDTYMRKLFELLKV